MTININININSNLSINININSNINITSTININISIWYTYIAFLFYIIFNILLHSHSHRPSLTHYIVRHNTISFYPYPSNTIYTSVPWQTILSSTQPISICFYYITPITSCVNYFNLFIITTIPTFF